jgi:hypothetical protein
MKEKLAMPCTKEQWEQEIKPRIEEIKGVRIIDVSDFHRFEFITNEYDEIDYNIGITNTIHGRIKIPYDPDRFCASLGEVKWMPLTRGGDEYKIYEEFDGVIWGRVKLNIWVAVSWNISGVCLSYNSGSWHDLIPYNPKQEAIKQEIAIKEKELEELKARLNK